MLKVDLNISIMRHEYVFRATAPLQVVLALREEGGRLSMWSSMDLLSYSKIF